MFVGLVPNGHMSQRDPRVDHIQGKQMDGGGILLGRSSQRLAVERDLTTLVATTLIPGEQTLLKRLQGGCQVPIAAFATLSGDRLEIDGMVAETDGSVMIREQMSGSAKDPESLGTALAEQLISRGAGDIVQRLIEEAQQS